ncbi:MAG: hypothetical protein LUQ50_02710 [Methanospirillum sp.]|uniref:hypothetical protein n=1 Tax=Methanospirillum sp. TaxID=45200 RepID=UPI0023734429|nr:hypothetical protein [Methanospirillum sp.]MDD1727965.1 hypothetical protein [Methanospirillum sp.]
MSSQTTGIGCDVEEIDRFCLDRDNDAAFLQRVLTSSELEYCYSFHHPAPILQHDSVPRKRL